MVHSKEQQNIPGYTFKTPDVATAPISMQDLQLLKQTVLFTEEDEKYLRQASEVLADQINDILDVWYNFVGSHEHLLYYFTSLNGQRHPNSEYLAAVRKRFEQWILDTCNRSYDQDWLNYQFEIGLRHHRTKKNQTDRVQSVPIINFRYLIAFIYPITATIKPFLAKKGHSLDDVEKMYQAWFKSVVLQVTLWCYPYVKDGDF
ncbi:MAG: protogloblin ApPgb [Chlorogloeopsis fritschii C42_A2020_084]|uniref:protoglobin domain-containing protein n=1 Tax=Chlorogloeopsis fritschii TaxID=1124 RepID=UPI0019E64280|nr:protoglobin domain-containing protein [Chlorogloeopsis fritschii]MBF2005120.1 protogloblin ApPgb [Chlorogloeopsis fritschii C42_A2020_084]